MNDRPRVPDGHYVAVASNPRMMQTSDGMPFVQVTCTLETGISVDGDCVSVPSGKHSMLLWRGSLTRGATARTYDALCAMGSTINKTMGEKAYDALIARAYRAEGQDYDRSVDCTPAEVLNGVGSRRFRVEVRSLLCDDNEAPGKWRTFIIGVHEILDQFKQDGPSVAKATVRYEDNDE